MGIVTIHDEYYRTEKSKDLKLLFAICRFENGDQMFDYVILFDSDDFLDEGNVCTACCDHKASIIKTNKKSCGPL